MPPLLDGEVLKNTISITFVDLFLLDWKFGSEDLPNSPVAKIIREGQSYWAIHQGTYRQM